MKTPGSNDIIASKCGSVSGVNHDISVRVFAHNVANYFGFCCGDFEQIDFLHEAGCDFWKTFSWDILNEGLQLKLQEISKKTFISTGVSGIEDVVKVSKKYTNIRFIHTQVSNEVIDVNLKAIRTIRAKTEVKVAFGLHCSEKNVIYLSLAYEPSDILFYVKSTDRNDYPDGPHAFLLSDVDKIINRINTLKQTIGDGQKLAMNRKWE